MSVDELKSKGNEAVKAKMYEDAIRWYTMAIDLDSESEAAGTLYSNRAACWQNMRDFTNALKDSDNCIRLRPSWIKGYFRKGVALESMEKYDDAVKTFQQALKVDPDNEEVLDKLQNLNLIIKNRNDKATPALCKTSEEAKIIGNSMFTSGRFEKAILFYSRAIELSAEKNQELANCYANRAACHQQTHNYHSVISDCDEALKIEPTHVKAFLRRAIAYEGLEKWKKALDDYNQVNIISPGLPAVSQGVLRCQRALKS